MTTPNPTIAIIGGGFAGMVTGILLQNHSISTTIYESRSEAYTSGGSIALAPNALRVLDHAGVYDRIRTRGFNYESIEFINNAGTKLGAFKNGSRDLYGYQALRIKRTIVRDALREQCRARGVEIVYGKRCEGVEEREAEEEKGTVMVRFADGSSVEAVLVVGADGIHSRVRSHVDSEALPYYSGQVGISGVVSEQELLSTPRHFGLPAMTFGGAGFFAVMPSTFKGDEIGYFATMDLPDRSREEWDALSADGDRLYELMSQSFLAENSCPEYIQTLVRKTPKKSLTCWAFFHAPALPSWLSPSGRVVLIGDAAHAMPPTGGQGAAMALEDAETLAHTVAETRISLLDLSSTQRNERLKPLIRAWEKHRHRRFSEALEFTNRNSAWRKAPGNLVEKAVKEWGIWVAMKFSGADSGASWLYGYSAESVKKELVW